MSSPHSKTVARRVRAHRARRLSEGYRLIQLWVPDEKQQTFKNQARKQSRAVAASKHAADDQAFVDAVSIWGDL